VRNVTLRDVARAAGVDYSTVSRALNPRTPANRLNRETVARIRRIADEIGYRRDVRAAGLAEGRTFSIGVAVADMGNPYVAPVLRGIQNTLESSDLTAIILETQDDHKRLERVLHHLAGRVDAMIVGCARHGSRELLEDFDATTRPVVLVLRSLPGSSLPAVTADDYVGGTLAAGYLGQLGHRSLAQVEGPGDIQPFPDRRSGFIDTARRLGVHVLDGAGRAEAPTVEEGRRVFTQMLAAAEAMPTGVFAHNDALAIGVVDAIRSSGLRCPEDISVIGFNDNPFSDHLSPPLSTIRVPGHDLGVAAGALAVRRIAGRLAPAEIHRHQPTLIVRASTARYRGGDHPSVAGPQPEG
jgi:LacI family transcriptional regulator